MAMKKSCIILALAAISFHSCGSAGGGKSAADTATASAAAAPVYDKDLPAGRVTDSVRCRQGGQLFALYLPSYYTPARAFPVVYFFDAHARGALPLRMYKELAEAYGFVLVGSDASKNGTPWAVNSTSVKALMDDTRGRINIDPRRIYTAGFSGGSRVAASAAIFIGGVAGVMGCAAGFPQLQQPLQSKFAYFGMVGDHDFNLMEMEELDGGLQQNGFAHQLLTSDGLHGWAPAADLRTALLWMQVNGMKDQLQPKSDTLIAALKKDYDSRIAAALVRHDLVKAQELSAGAVQALAGLADVTGYQQQSTQLVNGAPYKNELARQEQLFREEATAQQQLMNAYTTESRQWWQTRLAGLKRAGSDTRDAMAAKMNMRLVNYLGLVGYLTANGALKAGELDKAAAYLELFRQADPKNPDCPYLTAILYARRGDSRQTIAALNEAAGLGYSEVVTLMTEPAFEALHSTTEFQIAEQKIRRNYAERE